MRAVGRAGESLKGRYIIAEDVGTSVEDMAEIRKSTAHVVGLATEHRGGCDPSPLTAHGRFVGIRPPVDYVARTEGRGALRVAVQGLGHVGWPPCRLLPHASVAHSITGITG